MSLVWEFEPRLGAHGVLTRPCKFSPAARCAAEGGVVLTCERGSSNVQCRIGTATEAAAHADTSAAAVGETAATFRSGMRARTAPGYRAESLPRGERRIRGNGGPALRARGSG